MDSPDPSLAPDRGARVFATTRWTIVLKAGGSSTVGSSAALEQLCRAYWFPLYSFVRRRGVPAHDAEDLIQGFFAFLLEKDVIARADPERGRFRSFLLSSLQNFQANQRARTGTLKRGGAHAILSFDELQAEQRYQNEPATHLSPERVFDQKWAANLLEHVLETLRREYAAAGKGRVFEVLRPVVWGGGGPARYEEIGRTLAMSEGAIKVAVHRLRLRFKECLQAEVAHTVSSPAEVQDELRYLLSALSL